MKTFTAFIASASARWDFDSYVVRPVKEPEFTLGEKPLSELNCAPYRKKNLCTELNWNPVCGTDGKFRANPCIFKSEYCYGQTDVDFLRMGTDCTIDMLMDTDMKKEDLEVIEEPEEPECRIYCPRVYEPVCGDDGVLYDNDCQLRLRNCLNGTNVREQFGANRMLAQVCHAGVTYGNRDMFILAKCDAQRDGNKNARDWEATDGVCQLTRVQRCNKACPMINDPICGSDGIRYANECVMESVAACSGEEITRLRPPHRMYAPVCGSNGVQYSNDLVFLWAKCQAQDSESAKFSRKASNWKIAKNSPCEVKIEVEYEEEEEGEEEENNELLMDTGLPRLCPSCGTYESLVCGSNGQTYTNYCLMDKTACELNIPIEEVHAGSCCPRMHTRDIRPACGSDGKVYTNLSLLADASCQNDFSIRFVNEGQCMLMDDSGFGNDVEEEEAEPIEKKKSKKNKSGKNRLLSRFGRK